MRLGSYLRIIEPGDVGAGDPIELVERPDHEVTIGLLSRVLFEDSSLGPRILAADALTDARREHGERLAAGDKCLGACQERDNHRPVSRPNERPSQIRLSQSP
jgi:hypothetical protein